MGKEALDNITLDGALGIEDLSTWGTKPLLALFDAMDLDFILEDKNRYLIDAMIEHTKAFEACIYRLVDEAMSKEKD